MRAVVLRDGRLDVREVADPVPGPGEVLLRTLSTAICASDVHFMDHPEMGINDPTGRSLYDADRDIVLGHEFVGEVRTAPNNFRPAPASLPSPFG
jgi:threonine dehydrogenase-like Zn-dependent dehydrogenase